MAKILLIDDDHSISKIYGEKLKLSGFEVVIAITGEQALTVARENHFDLILLDIMLAGKMNGFDVLEKLKKNENLKKIPVLVLTNLDTEAKVAKDIGAAGYLVKANTDLKVLVEKVRSLL